MKKLLTLLFISGSIVTASAQKETDKWFFGQGAALDFSSGSPVVISPSPLFTIEGTASMSDATTGNLLFFTQGQDVYDATKTIMPNGTGLLGEMSSTHSAMIVPDPASATKYYVFTTGPDGTGDFRYSVVDMTLNGGLGDVVTASKNTFLTDSITEKIAAIRDGSNAVWIVTHKWGTDEFLSYHLTAAGVSGPLISRVGAVHIAGPGLLLANSHGQIKFNNCGTKLACAIGYQDIVEVFDFSTATGVVSNPLTLNLGAHVYGVEFSMSGTYLYVSNYSATASLAQFNITLSTLALINASKFPITATEDLYGLQMASNGKIYVSRSYATPFIGEIANPEVAGFGCNYSDFGVDLDPSFMGVNGALSLPGFMQDYLRIAGGISCLATGIEDVSSVANIVFPNPSADQFSIDLTNETATVTVYDAMGRLIEENSISRSLFVFGKEYQSGIYMVNILTGDQLRTQRVIKQ